MPRPWTPRERERAETGVLVRGFVDIRLIAREPDRAGDPAAALKRIHVIADACHNLTGAATWRRRGSRPDPFAWTWQTASPDQREWLVEIFQSLELDTAWLDTVPPKRPLDHARRTRIRFLRRKPQPEQSR